MEPPPPPPQPQPQSRPPAQFASLSDFTDELMLLSESLKRRAEGLAQREGRTAQREQALQAREAEFERTCARMQEGKDTYLAELEEELAAVRQRLQANEAQLARFRRERADVTQRLASTQSWLQDAESKAAQLSDQVRHQEKTAGARTDAQRNERRSTDRRVASLSAFVQVLFDLLEGDGATAPAKGRAACQLLPAPVREDPRVFEADLPDHGGLALQAFACVPELMSAQLVLDNVQMQQRCVEFMWFCVQRGTQSLPSISAHSRRRLVEVLATSMEDPDDDAEMIEDGGGGSRNRRGNVWCSSHDMIVSCLSLLLVLRLSLGHGSAEGAAGVAVGDARLLSRALVIARRMLETREGKRIFLLYHGMPVVSMLLRSRNRAVRAPAATIVLTMSAEGDHLPALFTACANEEWIRSCAIALTYSIRGVGSLVSQGRSASTVSTSRAEVTVAPHTEDAEDAHVQECLCVLLQRMSAKPGFCPLFRVANLHGILLDSAHSASNDKNR